MFPNLPKRIAILSNIERIRRGGGPQMFISPATGAADGDGTYGDPYNTAGAIAAIAALPAGDQGELQILIEAGTTFIGRIAITDRSGYSIAPYGDGERPLISNHVDASDLVWQADDGALGGPTANVYFMPVSGAASNWPAGDTSVTFHDGTDWVQCEGVADNSYADLIGTLYQCCETRYSTWPFRQMWNPGATPDRIWIRVPAGFDPNAAQCIYPVANEDVINITGGEGVTISDIVFQLGHVMGFAGVGVTGLTLNRVDGRNIGGALAPISQDVFGIQGTAIDARMQDLVMRSCKAYRSRRRDGSHALEISWLDNFTVDDFDVRDVRFHGIEFWNSNSNGLIRRMKCRQTYSAIYASLGTNDLADTDHHNILIQNLECVQRPTYVHHGTSAGQWGGGTGVILSSFAVNAKSFSEFRVMNSSFDLDGAPVLYAYIDGSDAGNAAGTMTFKNNAVRWTQATNAADGGMQVGAASAPAARFTIDYNVYQFGVSTTAMYRIGASAANSLSAAETLWDALRDGNEEHSVELAAGAGLFMVPNGTAQSTDLSLLNQVVLAIGMADDADADAPTTDILGVTRTDPDVGAYEYVIGSDSTPAAVDFVDAVNASGTVTSAAITITGLTAPANVTTDIGSFQINGAGGFVTSGTIYNGQTLEARHTASGTPGGVVVQTVTVGGLPITFQSTAIAGTPYDTRLSASQDDGTEQLPHTWYFNLNFVWDSGSGVWTGLSFPSVLMTHCSAATLTVNVTGYTAGGTMTLYGESQVAAASIAYSGVAPGPANYPSDKTLVATSVVSGTITGTGLVTFTGAGLVALLNEVMATANFASGGRINLILKPSASMNLSLSDVDADPSNAARLQMTPG